MSFVVYLHVINDEMIKKNLLMNIHVLKCCEIVNKQNKCEADADSDVDAFNRVNFQYKHAPLTHTQSALVSSHHYNIRTNTHTEMYTLIQCTHIAMFHLGFICWNIVLILLLYAFNSCSCWRHHSSIIVFSFNRVFFGYNVILFIVLWQMLKPMIFNYEIERHIDFDTFGVCVCVFGCANSHFIDVECRFRWNAGNNEVLIYPSNYFWVCMQNTWKLDKSKKIIIFYIICMKWIEMEIITRKPIHPKNLHQRIKFKQFFFLFKSTRKEIV